MDLKPYFEEKGGTGVLATADSEGRVDVAIYARPYVVDETTVAFIMADRTTRKNLLSNPSAAYLYLEAGGGYRGRRLFLTMQKELKGDEVTDPELKGKYQQACREYTGETLSVMYFGVERVLPLVSEA
jgi:hypothetical protein